ncbi:FliM/FliN family flagellar motor switch protein [Zobellella iuensis]|uniref:FliM/FliN family flagellar motor switch protein n=1 Tax=Zobellella iuensis TaxID=2803811 RepID=A0ABS1QVI8_9GAMM|nr:FliM/FliN family flagellar motor switch protein [Zobellella iuensis]
MHLVAPDALFPRYDFFRGNESAAQQSQHLVVCLEARKNTWHNRLEAMLYSTELSLSLHVTESLPESGTDEPFLCFSCGYELDGVAEPGPSLMMAHADLYQLAEMTFGGHPARRTAQHKRPVSETERRLGLSLLSLFGQDVLAQLVPGSLMEQGSMVPVPQARHDSAATIIVVELVLSGQSMQWYLLLPSLTRPAQPPAVTDTRQLELAGALQEILPQLRTRLSIPLAECELPLGSLAGLRAGDVLPVSLFHEVTARVGEQPLLKGRVAEQQGMLVFASHGFID